MNDYPSDDEVDEMFGKAWETCRDKRANAQKAAIVRLAVDWARTNPAPQEPPTGLGCWPVRCPHCGLEETSSNEPPHCWWDHDGNCSECGAHPFTATAEEMRAQSGLLPSRAHAEPTEAPKPTSGDKPPNTMGVGERICTAWKMLERDNPNNPDPRNPSPTPEPADPWALPDALRRALRSAASGLLFSQRRALAGLDTIDVAPGSSGFGLRTRGLLDEHGMRTPEGWAVREYIRCGGRTDPSMESEG